jgi:hypothetical protein
LGESLLHPGIALISPLGGIGDQTPQLWGELLQSSVSFGFQLGWIANLSPRLSVSGNAGDSRSDFFSFRQSAFSFIQCFLPCVQFRLALSKLLFSGCILFLA